MHDVSPTQKIKRDEILRFSPGKVIKSYFLRTPPGQSIAGHDEVIPLGAGGSSKVYLADQVLHEGVSIPRAIKFFMFADDVAELTQHRAHTPVSKDDFLNEVLNMSGFSHENLTKVTDAGIETIQSLDIPYLVSDFVDGPTIQQLRDPSSGIAEEASKLLAEDVTKLLEMLIQIATGVAHLHRRQFFHCDIAPKNIFLMVRDGDCKPIIGDLGVGRNLASGSGRVFVAGSRGYMSPEAESYRYKEIDWGVFRALQPRWDIYGLAQTGQFLMEAFTPARKPAWWLPLLHAFDDCKSGQKYHTVKALLDRLKWLLPVHREMGAVPELSSSLSGRSRKLMPVAPLVTSRRIKKIIQHPALLRLTKVPQLLTSHDVYPSGNHTRYEHSLGVLETMRQYLVSLLDQEEFLEHLTPSKIETALICAALSNVIRFPLYHVLDEVAHALPNQFTAFRKAALLKNALAISDSRGQSLGALIGEHFPSVIIDDVVNILTDNRGSFTDEDHLIHSMLNCSLDARVVDFLRRDSHHLGLANEGFHLDDLLPFLTILNHRLALKTQGMSVAEHIISLRYWMFSRVYWSNPNRSIVAMARHLILNLSRVDEFIARLQSRLFTLTEEEFLQFLKNEAHRSQNNQLEDLASLLCSVPQNTYWVIFNASTKESPEFGVIVEKVAKMSLLELDRLRTDLTSAIRPLLTNTVERRLLTQGSKRAREDAESIVRNKICVLLDIPIEPGSGSKLGDDILGIPENGSPAMLKHLSGIVGGINDSFLNHLRRFRVMLHPDVAAREPLDRKAVQDFIMEFLKQSL